MYYRHDLDYRYPERCDEHMITVKHLRDVNVDANYPYRRKDLGYKLLRGLYWVGLNCLMFPLIRLTHGLRIYGRKNLKKHKDALKNGAITISNHVFMWDYICVMKAVRPHIGFFPAWKTNLEGPNGPLIRLAGGIPIPTDSIRATIKFKKAMEEVFEEGRWMHFFPEGSMWFFYPDVRPLKKAVFQYAVKYDRPIVPLAFSFRPRKGLAKLFGKTPRVDLHVGEPLFPDQTLSPAEAAKTLHETAYHLMQGMVGVHPDSPTYNTHQNPLHYEKTM